jgi:hypothetical protein
MVADGLALDECGTRIARPRQVEVGFCAFLQKDVPVNDTIVWSGRRTHVGPRQGACNATLVAAAPPPACSSVLAELFQRVCQPFSPLDGIVIKHHHVLERGTSLRLPELSEF